MIKENQFLSLHFELTNKCNLRCNHCYNIKYLDNAATDLSTSDVKQIIDIAKRVGIQDIGFSGGEPFMREDMLELIEYAKEYPIHILTNGLLLNKTKINQINQIKDLLVEFRVSLDGIEAHKKLRNVGYKVVLNNIQELLNNDYVVTINTMVTNDNISELEGMYDLMKEISVDRWRLDFIFYAGNASTNNLGYSDNENFFVILKRIIEKYIQERPSFELDINKLFRSAFLEDFKSTRYTKESKPCSYQGSLTVRPNGDVSYCPSLDITYGNILKDEINTIITSQEWVNFSNIKVRDLPNKCLDCKYMEYCGGGCRADAYYCTNDLHGICDFTCQAISFYVDEILPMLNKI